MVRDLLSGELDFLLARVPDELDADEFDAHAIGVEEARLVVRSGHPLLARTAARLTDVAACDWVMQPRGTPLRRALDGLFLAANLPPPRRLLATTSLTMTLMTVAKSDAIAPMSREVARFACDDLAPAKLGILPTDFPLVVQPYSLVCARKRPLSPAARTVYDAIRELAAHGPATSSLR